MVTIRNFCIPTSYDLQLCPFAVRQVMQHMLHEHGVCVEYNPFANSRENSLDEAAPTAPRRGSVQETLLRRISSVWLA